MNATRVQLACLLLQLCLDVSGLLFEDEDFLISVLQILNELLLFHNQVLYSRISLLVGSAATESSCSECALLEVLISSVTSVCLTSDF